MVEPRFPGWQRNVFNYNSAWFYQHWNFTTHNIHLAPTPIQERTLCDLPPSDQNMAIFVNCYDILQPREWILYFHYSKCSLSYEHLSRSLKFFMYSNDYFEHASISSFFSKILWWVHKLFCFTFSQSKFSFLYA